LNAKNEEKTFSFAEIYSSSTSSNAGSPRRDEQNAVSGAGVGVGRGIVRSSASYGIQQMLREEVPKIMPNCVNLSLSDPFGGEDSLGETSPRAK